MAMAALGACHQTPETPPASAPVSESVAASASEAMASSSDDGGPTYSDLIQGQRFLAALKAGNDHLAVYGLPPRPSDADIAHFNQMRAIAAKEDLIAVEYAGGPGESAIVFLPPADQSHVLSADQAFLQKNYMKTLFACDFHITGGHWTFGDPPYCYSKGKGPFES